jgi:hypothetical protein
MKPESCRTKKRPLTEPNPQVSESHTLALKASSGRAHWAPSGWFTCQDKPQQCYETDFRRIVAAAVSKAQLARQIAQGAIVPAVTTR